MSIFIFKNIANSYINNTRKIIKNSQFLSIYSHFLLLLSYKILYPEDLKTAEKIYCFNSVRGVVEVELCW